MYGCLPACIAVYCMCLVPMEAGRGHWISWDGCSAWCWELDLGPLQEQLVLLAAKLSLNFPTLMQSFHVAQAGLYPRLASNLYFSYFTLPTDGIRDTTYFPVLCSDFYSSTDFSHVLYHITLSSAVSCSLGRIVY